MKKLLFFLLFISTAFSEPWCDLGSFCNSSFFCRGEISIGSLGTARILPANFSDLLPQCGSPGELDNASLRILLNNAAMPFNFSNQGIFFNATELGRYFLYFSNITENETKPEANISFVNENSITIGCTKLGSCAGAGITPCPAVQETNKIIYKMEMHAHCDQAVLGVYCTGSSFFGGCGCTTGYDAGYATTCASICYGNFSNGTAIGVTTMTAGFFCQSGVWGDFYYLDFDFGANIDKIESFYSYNASLFQQAQSPVQESPAQLISFGGWSFAQEPTIILNRQTKPFFNISITEPQNDTTINSSVLEFKAEIENNTEIDCLLSLDSKGTGFFFENNILSRAFIISNGAHEILLTCSNNETTQESQILFNSKYLNNIPTKQQTTQRATPITSEATSNDNLYLGIAIFIAAIIISGRKLLSKKQKHRENSNLSQ